MATANGTAGERRRRITDLARDAGLSTQQIRNYADSGLLPETARTDSGYRVFTARHAAAIGVVRRMGEGHGWAATKTIMHAVHAGELETALAVLDRGHAELDRERAEIAAVLGAVETVVSGRGVPGPARRRLLRIGEVAAVAGVRTSSLRVWEERGLLRPERERPTGYRVYDDAEVRAARIVALLRRGGYPLPIVAAVLGELRAGSPERVRAALAERERDLHRRSLRRLRASAALYGYLESFGPEARRG